MSKVISSWPTTQAGWCALYKRLDREFKTTTNSPLHHDNRCPRCR
jgi:hypothetical protein